MAANRFEIIATRGGARAGLLHTPHGIIETPAFLPVGTKATVKSLVPQMVKEAGAPALLANTYHLFLQPGDQTISEAGGLHTFMGWDGPIMTDSGGFQVFSLGAAYGKNVTKVAHEDIDAVPRSTPTIFDEDIASQHGQLAVIDEEGVTFTSHIDGTLHRFTPERSIEIQHNLGADIIVAFDECTAATATYEYQREAMLRTHRWAHRSLRAHQGNITQAAVQLLMGVVQGGRHEDLRRHSAQSLAQMGFPAFAIGGSYVKADLDTAVGWVCEELPPEAPRHLLGIGEPEDLRAGIEKGIDTFDCVQPTRLARTGVVYGPGGVKLALRHADFARDFVPIDETCTCGTCQHFTRAYLSHLFRAREMLGATLASIHNIHYLTSVVAQIRTQLMSRS
jgi:queuine tRNA-ribosyltransferase